jgi:hypothetical protein
VNNEEEAADGQIHFLNDDFGYILKRIDSSSLDNLLTAHSQMIEEYAKYLMKHESEKALEILCGHLLYDYQEDFQLNYRPPWVVSSLAQNAIVTLKFKRIDRK